MADTVSQILTQAKAIAAATLGTGWNELPYVLDVSKNDERRAKQGYGVRPLPANEAPSVTNSYALDHGFELVLMGSVAKPDDESQAMTLIGTLYDKQDEIFKSMARAKLNLPGTVLLVSQPALSEPEILASGKLIALRQQFNVRYRQAI